MELLHVRRLHTRYRLPESRQNERERLDRVLREVLDEGLDAALERAGVSPHEVVCIRSLHVPVRLRLSSADYSLMLAWSQALAESITRSRDARYFPNVVRYSSPVHVLIDMAVSIARESFERVWAWRIAGVWRGSDVPGVAEAVYEFVRALERQPSAIVPVLTAVAGRNLPGGTFLRLARALDEAQWIALAHAALQSAGLPPSVLDETVEPGIAEVAAQARRILSKSVLAQAIREAFSDDAAEFPFTRNRARLLSLERVETRRALAALMALSHDPGSLRPAQRGRAFISALADAMHPATTARGEAERWSAHPPAPAAPPRREARPERTQAEFEEAPVEVRQRARTRYGGLLFLLGLIEQLGIPDEIAARFERRPFRWALHQLALALVSASPGDAAALAFAGLPPDCRPPSLGEESPARAELDTISSFTARIEAALEDTLERKHPIAFVCEREAEILADPGWIEVRLPMSEVSTEIRRAGLDLDPGYVPWLGVVVRFVYA